MSLKIICSGHLIRHPLGGHTWHHLQYLLGFERMGHEVIFMEHFGWPNSCYDAARDEMGDDPAYGIAYMQRVFDRCGFSGRWCFLGADGRAYGMPREQLAQFCRECDVYFNLSNINWIDELALCRRRCLVDTDPVFTQIGGHGIGGPLENYHVRVTYAQNVHRRDCSMPTGGFRWLPTRQPVILDLWPFEEGDPNRPLSTLINWTAYGDHTHAGRDYGQKDREFSRFFNLPQTAGAQMEIAINGPAEIKDRFATGGWQLADPLEISRDPWTYQRYLTALEGRVLRRQAWLCMHAVRLVQ